MSPEEIQILSSTRVTTRQFTIDPNTLNKIFELYMEKDYVKEINYLEQIWGTIFNEINTDLKNGISNDVEEKNKRSNYFGANINETSKIIPSFYRLFKSNFNNYTIQTLIMASIISIIVSASTSDNDSITSSWIEGFGICISLVIIAITSTTNEYQIERDYQKLNNSFEFGKSVDVIREGIIMRIHKNELLVGDILDIESGMLVPADSLIIESVDLSTDEFYFSMSNILKKKSDLRKCISKKEIIKNYTKYKMDWSDEFPSCILLGGTKVMTGEAKIVVLGVGSNMMCEKFNKRKGKNLMNLENATPLQRELKELSNNIGKFAILSATIILLILLLRFIIGKSTTGDWDNSKDWRRLVHYFIISMSILVLAIPEGLPLVVVLTIMYSIKKMMKEDNNVRRLDACEKMAKVSSICCDKTGTLTYNKMVLTAIWNNKYYAIDTYSSIISLSSYIPKDIQDLFIFSIISNCSAKMLPVPTGSKIEIALLNFLNKCMINIEEYEKKYHKIFKIPFNSIIKKMCSVIQIEDKRKFFVKGAADLLMKSCSHFHNFDNTIQVMSEEKKSSIIEAIEELSLDGLKVLCFCYKENDMWEGELEISEENIYIMGKNDFTFLCLCAFQDKIRADACTAIKKCKEAGIKVRMVTGAHIITAKTIAKECGIIESDDENSLVMEGQEFMKLVKGIVCSSCKTSYCYCPKTLQESEFLNRPLRIDTIGDQAAFTNIISKLCVIARTRPQHKLALLYGLKNNNEIVAVTGDGNNDALALSKADVGFAMGITGVEITKESASIILLDDNFNSIVKSIIWGRNIYESIRKFLVFQLTVNISAVICSIIFSIFIENSVLEPVQLLWINLIMDTLASLALATENASEKLLQKKSNIQKDNIFTRKMLKHIIGQSFYQIIIMIIIVFDGENFLPEYSDIYDTLIEQKDEWNYTFKYNSAFYPQKKLVRSGRYKEVGGLVNDYGDLIVVTPSRHMTICFNIFVLLQIFNFFNCRRINDELNIFESIKSHYLFIIIVGLITCLQIILISFGGHAIQCYLWGGLSIEQWGISIIFGFSCIIWSYMLRFLPEDKCFGFFKTT